MARRCSLFVVSIVVAVGASACVAPGLVPLSGVGAGSSTPTTAPSAPSSSWDAAMLGSINAARAAVGAAPLAACGSLNAAAAAHSADQAATSTMSHTGSDGSTMVVRAERSGYLRWTRLAENVAAGYPTVDAVMAGWMASDGHRANLLNPALTHVGVGRTQSTAGTWYWTQDFGTGGTC